MLGTKQPVAIQFHNEHGRNIFIGQLPFNNIDALINLPFRLCGRKAEKDATCRETKYGEGDKADIVKDCECHSNLCNAERRQLPNTAGQITSNYWFLLAASILANGNRLDM